jgi:hypothetical protein
MLAKRNVEATLPTRDRPTNPIRRLPKTSLVALATLLAALPIAVVIAIVALEAAIVNLPLWKRLKRQWSRKRRIVMLRQKTVIEKGVVALGVAPVVNAVVSEAVVDATSSLQVAVVEEPLPVGMIAKGVTTIVLL